MIRPASDLCHTIWEDYDPCPAGFAGIPLCCPVGINCDFIFLHFYIISIILNLSSSRPRKRDRSKTARRSTLKPSTNVSLKESTPLKNDIALTRPEEASEKVISICSPPFLPNFLIFSTLTFSKRKTGLGLPSPKGESFSISRQFLG